jgi:7-cyano-7-deazaguanine synthase
MMNGGPAMVLFSGGQDSTTCLAWALKRFQHVETVGFDYGQRHRIEIECREGIRRRIADVLPQWSSRLGDDHLLSIPVLAEISETALTSETGIALLETGLPNTFVPGRNLLFLTLAAAVAYRRGIRCLVGGMCDTDFSGYPDCRRETVDAMAQTLTLGMATPFVVETPLMRLTKADTWKLAEEIGGARFVELVVSDTHTCYLGQRSTFHEWGYGCGACPACEIRARGYRNWRDRHELRR